MVISRHRVNNDFTIYLLCEETRLCGTRPVLFRRPMVVAVKGGGLRADGRGTQVWGSKSLSASRGLPKHSLTVDHNVVKVTHDALLVDIDQLPRPFIMDTRSNSPSPRLDAELPQDN